MSKMEGDKQRKSQLGGSDGKTQGSLREEPALPRPKWSEEPITV